MCNWLDARVYTKCSTPSNPSSMNFGFKRSQDLMKTFLNCQWIQIFVISFKYYITYINYQMAINGDVLCDIPGKQYNISVGFVIHSS